MTYQCSLFVMTVTLLLLLLLHVDSDSSVPIRHQSEHALLSHYNGNIGKDSIRNHTALSSNKELNELFVSESTSLSEESTGDDEGHSSFTALLQNTRGFDDSVLRWNHFDSDFSTDDGQKTEILCSNCDNDASSETHSLHTVDLSSTIESESEVEQYLTFGHENTPKVWSDNTRLLRRQGWNAVTCSNCLSMWYDVVLVRHGVSKQSPWLTRPCKKYDSLLPTLPSSDAAHYRRACLRVQAALFEVPSNQMLNGADYLCMALSLGDCTKYELANQNFPGKIASSPLVWRDSSVLTNPIQASSSSSSSLSSTTVETFHIRETTCSMCNHLMKFRDNIDSSRTKRGKLRVNSIDSFSWKTACTSYAHQQTTFLNQLMMDEDKQKFIRSKHIPEIITNVLRCEGIRQHIGRLWNKQYAPMMNNLEVDISKDKLYMMACLRNNLCQQWTRSMCAQCASGWYRRVLLLKGVSPISPWTQSVCDMIVDETDRINCNTILPALYENTTLTQLQNGPESFCCTASRGFCSTYFQASSDCSSCECKASIYGVKCIDSKEFAVIQVGHFRDDVFAPLAVSSLEDPRYEIIVCHLCFVLGSLLPQSEPWSDDNFWVQACDTVAANQENARINSKDEWSASQSVSKSLDLALRCYAIQRYMEKMKAFIPQSLPRRFENTNEIPSDNEHVQKMCIFNELCPLPDMPAPME